MTVSYRKLSVQVVRQPARRCIIDSQAQQDSRETYVPVSLGREERDRAAAYSLCILRGFPGIRFSFLLANCASIFTLSSFLVELLKFFSVTKILEIFAVSAIYLIYCSYVHVIIRKSKS